MSRQCSRPACAREASATMAYDYGARVAWLDDIHDVASPHTYDLCPAHGDRLSVPMGWELRDRRVSAVRLLFASAV